MSVCFECGHLQLYYIPSCNDPVVGSSQVMLFNGPQMEAIEADIALFSAHLQAMIDAQEAEDLEQAALEQDTIAELLRGYVPPTSDATPGRHLVQAFKIETKQWVYIRSDKLHEPMRKYTIRASLLEPTAQGNMRQLARDALASAWDTVSADVKNDLSAGLPSPSGTVVKGELAASLSDKWKNNFTAWVDDVNRSLTASGSNANFDISAAAQIFRFYAGYVVEVGRDPKTGTYSATASGNARAVLAEAKADLNAYLPNRDGWHALIDWGNPATMSNSGTSNASATQLDFGYFRFRAALGVDAMAGASVMGTIGVSYTPLPDGKVLAEGASYGGKGEVAVGAFAGVEASAEVKGALEWDNPAKRASSGQLGWAPVYEVGVQIAANAGIGVEAQFKIGLHPATGKLYVTCGAQLVIGVGAKGSLAAAIGLNTIYDFVMYVWQQLAANNFSKLEFISLAAFRAICQVAYMLIVKPAADLGNAIGAVVLDAVQFFRNEFNSRREKNEYATAVQRNTQMLLHAPPEIKGRIMYELGEDHWGMDELAEGALLTVMRSIQGRREWDQVRERISPDGSKVGYAAGLRRVNNVLDGGSFTEFHRLKNELMSLEVQPDTAPTLRVSRTEN